MLEKTIMLFDDHHKTILYGLIGCLIIAGIAGPLMGAMEAHGWNV